MVEYDDSNRMESSLAAEVLSTRTKDYTVLNPIRTLRDLPDQKILDAMLDRWAWTVAPKYFGVPWSVRDVRETLRTRLAPDGWEVAVTGIDIDPLTVGALADSLSAFASGFMAGVCYERGLKYDELEG